MYMTLVLQVLQNMSPSSLNCSINCIHKIVSGMGSNTMCSSKIIHSKFKIQKHNLSIPSCGILFLPDSEKLITIPMIIRSISITSNLLLTSTDGKKCWYILNIKMFDLVSPNIKIEK